MPSWWNHDVWQVPEMLVTPGWKRQTGVVVLAVWIVHSIILAANIYFVSSVRAITPNVATTGMHDPSWRRLNPLAEETDYPAPPLFNGNSSSGHICAFIPGYFAFLPETTVVVSSAMEFMPDMRVAIATSPGDFHVFTRFESCRRCCLCSRCFNFS